MTTEIKEIVSTNQITAYMLMKLSKEGQFTQHLPTYGTHKMLGGYWGDLNEAQHEQMLQALLGQQLRLFQIDWKI